MNRYLLLFLVFGLFIAGCTQPGEEATPTATPAAPAAPGSTSVESTPAGGGTITLGGILPLSGGAAAYGIPVQQGMQLAVEEINELGGVNGKMLEIVYEDTQCSSTMAANGIQKLISEDGVQAVVGEMCSSATLPASVIAEQNGVVLISPASTSPALTNAGDYIFRTVPSDTVQAKQTAELVHNLGYRTVAMLYINDDYGLGFTDVFEAESNALGVEIVAREAFERDTTNLRTHLTKIKIENPDALLIVSNAPAPAAAALKQAKELAINAQVFASEGLYDESVIEGAAGGAGGMFINYLGPSDAFKSAYRTRYGEGPGIFAAEAYDAVHAIAKAIQQGGGGRTQIKDALYGVGFDGASGSIAFDANGDLQEDPSESAYDVARVVDGEFVPYP